MTFPSGPLTGAPVGLVPDGTKFFWEEMSQTGNAFQFQYATRNVGANGAYTATFRIPSDFGTLLSLELILSDTVDFPGGDIELSSAYARVGESITRTTENVLLVGFTQTGLLWNSIDLRPIYTQLRANDYCGCRWDHQALSGDGFPYLGIYGTYN